MIKHFKTGVCVHWNMQCKQPTAKDSFAEAKGGMYWLDSRTHSCHSYSQTP
jgi:hypothetical protein